MNKKRTGVNIAVDVVKYAILIAGALITLLPFVYMILSALKTNAEIRSIPPVFFPASPQFVNFVTAWNSAPFGRYFFNTIFVAVVDTLGVLATTILASFAFARLEFPGKKVVFMLFLATMMVPSEMLVITNYMTISKLHWIDTYQAMIVPWLASVFNIYLLTQFFSSVPDALYLAAKADHCHDFKYMCKVMVPMNRGPIMTVAILNFIASWNSFMWPLLVTNSREMRVLSYGLVSFQTEEGARTELIMAASCLMVLPIIVIYLFMRDTIINGVTQGGIKG
ncbi:MAG: carbohydrate ABC transporter permease [Lachnospiraceae bacterium]|jgi:multiple sugar transport system permease protein